MKIRVNVNGQSREVDLPPLVRLLDALRGPMGLTGTKEGCGEGECGSCTVLLDGVPVNACLVSIGQCEGRNVTTVAPGMRSATGRHSSASSPPAWMMRTVGPDPRISA